MKIGKTKRRLRSFADLFRERAKSKKRDIEPVIEHDKRQELELLLESEERLDPSSESETILNEEKRGRVLSRNALEKFAYDKLSGHLPSVPRYREAFEQSGIPIIFESYISTAILLSVVAIVPGTFVSFVFLSLIFHAPLIVSIMDGIAVGATVFGVSLLLWIIYPLQRRRSFRAKLEAQLPYSFGILGVLSAAGMNIERMFERIAVSDSNPVLASLARRFIRDIKMFGLDTEAALREVARHSPSTSFAKMLESISVSFRTTGSVHDLIMFESARLLSERSDKLKKKIGDLAIMAELYITLVVVGPIIFIVMLSILQLLPYSESLPSIPAINALVFVGIPVISIGFTLILDSLVSRI